MSIKDELNLKTALSMSLNYCNTAVLSCPHVLRHQTVSMPFFCPLACISWFPPRYKSCFNPVTDLGQVLRGVALVRLDNLARSQLLISVRWVNDLLSLDDSQSLESIALAELTAPAARYGESAALDIAVACAVGRVASDLVRAWSGSTAVVGVDGVAVVAGSAGANTLEVLHRPGRASSHHGNVGGWSWGSKDAACGGQNGEEGGGELHVDDWWLIDWLIWFEGFVMLMMLVYLAMLLAALDGKMFC